MKIYLFLLIVVILIPCSGISQVSNTASPWTNVLAVDVNLAFGPSSTATWDPSVGFRLQVNDHFRVGIGDVSFGSADLLSGTRYAIMAGPVVEFLSPVSQNLSYSIQAGIPLQNRWGAGIEHSFGVAPYGSLALEYQFSNVFALAGIFRLQYIATDAYLRSPRVLPSSALIAAFGLGFHFFL